MVNADCTLLPVKVSRSQVSSLPIVTPRAEGTPISTIKNEKAKQLIKQRMMMTTTVIERLIRRLVKLLAGSDLALWAKVLAVDSIREKAWLPLFVCCTSSYASSPPNRMPNFRAILCANSRRDDRVVIADKAFSSYTSED